MRRQQVASYLPPRFLLFFFSGLFRPTAGDECCPAVSGELLELNRSVKLELQKLWFNCYYSRQFESNDCLIAAALSGSKHTRTI